MCRAPSGLASGCTAQGDERTTLSFFQFKGEAAQYFRDLAADFEQAVTELVGRQTAYQAAMLATSRVMGMNLTDYLR